MLFEQVLGLLILLILLPRLLLLLLEDADGECDVAIDDEKEDKKRC